MGVNFWQRSDSSDPTASPHEFGLPSCDQESVFVGLVARADRRNCPGCGLPHDRRSGAMLR